MNLVGYSELSYLFFYSDVDSRGPLFIDVLLVSLLIIFIELIPITSLPWGNYTTLKFLSFSLFFYLIKVENTVFVLYALVFINLLTDNDVFLGWY